MATKKQRRTSGKTVRVIEKQRKIQREVDQAEAKKGGEQKKRGGVQTGARRYPANPLPKQHHAKPGIESQIEPRPMFDNPAYRGSGRRCVVIKGDISDQEFCEEA